jgi:hypothetical protein
MHESATLYRLLDLTDQRNMIAVLKNPKADLAPTDCRTCGPNDDFPLPWKIVKFPGLKGACSIISVGGDFDNTVVSMTDVETAEKVLEEVNEADT